ncbi:MAG: methyltransferase domain-containing protein [Thermaceae bacterium]|nr:methyltransferase domain-containing protein [Thermaceae bacterium]
MQTPATTPDLAAIKGRQQKTWSSGNYARVGNTLVLMGERLCEAVDLKAGQVVLDVATGSGNTALSAARRFAQVTGIDYVPSLLEQARARATAEGLEVDFREGDAENLEFPTAHFDAVLSTVGAMFAPNQEKVAHELLRVTRPGGKIGLVNWTPEGFIGQLFKVTGQHVPPPAGLKPPPLWGTEARLEELFGEGVSSLETQRQHFVFRYHSAQHFVEFFRTFYGPTLKAFEALDEAGQTSLAQGIEALANRFNRTSHDTLAIDSEYLEVVAVRR